MLIKQIITERALKNKTWQGVAIAIGGNNTADGVRQMYNRHFKNIGN